MLSPELEEHLRHIAKVGDDCTCEGTCVCSDPCPAYLRDCFEEIDRLRFTMTDMADELGSYISAGRINCVGADNVVAGLRHAAKAAGGE